MRRSNHANEWAVYAEVRPDPTQAPTGYVCLEPEKSYVDEFGVTQHPPASFDMLPAATDEQATFTVLETEVVVGDQIHRNRLTSSNRHMCPVAWETEIEDTSLATTFTKSWLLIGNEAGTGAAMQTNEAMVERLGDDDVLFHNPTQAGAGQTIEGIEDPTGDPYRNLRTYGGKVLYYSASGNVHESCVVPPEFGGYFPTYATADGKEGQNHGAGITSPAIWYGMRHYQRVEMNWRGSAHIHRIDYWTYSPVAFDNGGVGGPIANWRTATMQSIAGTFDSMTIADMANLGGAVTLTDYAPPGDVDWFKNWIVGREKSTLPDGSIIPTNLGQYLAAMMGSAADNFGVAVACKMRLSDADVPIQAQQRIRGAPNYFLIQQYRAAGASGSATEPWAQVLDLQSKTEGPRPAGWIGSCHYVLTGRPSEILTALTALFASGDLDLDPISTLPPAVTAGTIWPTGSAIPTPLATVDVVLITGNDQEALSSKDYLHQDANAELGKFSRDEPIVPGLALRTTDERKRVWNDSTRRWEMLQHDKNASGWAHSARNQFGCETAVTQGLLEREGIDDVFVIKLCSSDSSLSGRGFGGVWNTPSSTPFVRTASATVAIVTDGATFTAAAGTFDDVVAGMGVFISGSAGYLTQTGVAYVGGWPTGGNNTDENKQVFVSAVNGDGSVLTLKNDSGNGVSYTFAVETASFTWTFGQLDLRAAAEATVARALDDLRIALRLEPRLRLTVSRLGDADLGATASEYQELVEDHAAWMRGLFDVDQSAAQCPPHAVVLMSPHIGIGTDGEIEAIRAGQSDAAAAIHNAIEVETSDLTVRIESTTWPATEREDNAVHLTPAANLEIGWRIDAELDSFDWFPAKAQSIDDAINPAGRSYFHLLGDSTVSLIVEDGTGLADANSYTTVDFGNDYFAAIGGNAIWTAADNSERESALRYATHWIDATYGERFVGYRSVSTQALQVPRSLAYDGDGRAIEGVPIGLERATVEVAVRWLADPTQLFPDTQAGANVDTTTSTLGPLSISKRFQGTATTAKSFPVVDRLLRLSGLLATSKRGVR